MNVNVPDRMDEDYKKIAHQVNQLRQITRPIAEQAASPKHAPNAEAGQDCIFCRIAKREMPARVVEENSAFVAFLDIQPKAAGHTIIISKRHFVGMDEMNNVESSLLLDTISTIAKRMKGNLKATGYSVVSSNGVSSGQIVPHFAVHLIPTYTHTVDLPIMSIIQPQKVPDFMMADIERLLRRTEK